MEEEKYKFDLTGETTMALEQSKIESTNVNTTNKPFTIKQSLKKKLTPEEFKKYILLDNDDIHIDDIDLNPPKITV